jgi:methionyl-tRNA formyltransferase
MKNLRIVFMGTPEFAVGTLGTLLMNGFNVVGVITAPDRPAGRGRKIKKSSVREFCELSSLPVLQPDNLKDPVFLQNLRDFNADIFIVVAFRMLPEVVWNMPPYGTINLHASLLPHYRGAAPINHVLINGEKITGVTTFLINENIDTGNILLREEIPIYAYETAGDLEKRLMKIGARLMIRTITGILKNTITPLPQSQFLKTGEIPIQAPKIFPEDCIINWSRSSVKIDNLVRGLSPSPCARSVLYKDKYELSFKIFESRPHHEKHNYNPGHIITDEKKKLWIACGKGFLEILSIQVEGKKRMNTSEFLRGFRINDIRIGLKPQV